MNLWEQILARVETKVNRHSFYTWFKPTTFIGADSRTISVRVPNPLFKDWLTKHYSGVIAEALGEVQKPKLDVSFVAEPHAEAALVAMGGAEESLPLETEAALAAGPGPAGLNPRYTFDTFIVGSSNQFAHAACRAVAEAPSRSYNPLFIYGGVGLGKTHLMHAVGQYVLRHDRNLKLTYISSERFMNEMINAVRYDRIIDFRERYRSVDVLLVDDIQFIAGKEGDTERVLPHLQRPLRLAEADRHQQRLSAARDSRARRAAALPFRVGPDRRHPVAGSRDENRDSEEKGGRRSGASARQRRHLHRQQDQVEHPRARRLADSPDRVRVADGPGTLARRWPRKC